MLGGVGYRFNVTPRLHVYPQLGIGSGGYAPDKIELGVYMQPWREIEAIAHAAEQLVIKRHALIADGQTDEPVGIRRHEMRKLEISKLEAALVRCFGVDLVDFHQPHCQCVL